jgi:gliding motility-associated-like protein
VLKLAQADGSVSWVRGGGSADGVDQPNGVSVGPDGSIAVAGEFRGTAVFDQGSITSITDPVTGDPSVDIFLATYTSAGAPLWIEQGAAEFADRGMDVEHDANGNLYLTGQFTDTLTLAGNVHENAMFSAVFIARFTPGGVEEWFRVFGGGTYNQVFEMVLAPAGHLMLVGDVQGTVIFLDTEPDLFTAVEPRSSFLLKVGLDGELIAQKTWGSQHPLSTRALSVQEEDVAVLGRFACQLTGFTGQYGESSFLGSGRWDLYVARFQTSDLDFKQAQHFAGIGEKLPGGVVHAPDAEPVFNGAFEHVLSFPSDGSMNLWPPGSGNTAPAPPGYCTDPFYSNYNLLRGWALKDAFIARGYHDGREPHDAYGREGSGCDRAFREPVIRVASEGVLGPDSLERCTQAALHAHTFTAFDPDTAVRHNAPAFEFLWSTGVTEPDITVYTSGWYWVDVRIGQQCFVWRDSLYVTVHPTPAVPLINDDVVVNVDALGPQLIRVCEPQQPWLWATNVDPANSIWWSVLGGIIANNDSAQAFTSGLYAVTVMTPAGCQRSNIVSVIIDPSGPLPPFDIELLTNYPQDDNDDDTIRVCEGSDIILQAAAEISLFGSPSPITYGVTALYDCTAYGSLQPTINNLPGFLCQYPFTVEGWYYHTVRFALTNAPCGEDTIYVTRSDSIYVIPLPLEEPALSATGSAWICPGDTVALTGSCPNCTVTTWTGPGIINVTDGTATVISEGSFTFAGYTLSDEGCNGFGTLGLAVNWNPLPPLFVDPLDAIICPNDSATIWTDAPGGDWQWFGPLGPLSVYNDTIYTSQQGVYYLEMVDTLGCLVTSNPILVTDYATPFLNILPDNVICEPGETSILQVVTTSESTLLWEAPFAGSSAVQQTVTQPGIYTCSVNACDITTVLSVQVFGNEAEAALTVPGPFTLCPGDEVTLEAQPGQAIYYWEPGPIFSTSVTTDTTGNYLLVVADPNGCRDSLWTQVTVLPEYEELELVNAVFCAGLPVTVVVSGDEVITWYADAAMTQIIGTGNALSMPGVTSDTTVWVGQVVGPCSSGLLQVDVSVYEVPEVPMVLGDTSVCEGSALLLTTQPQAGVTDVVWYGPNGVYDADTLAIDPVLLSDQGTWMLVVGNPACVQPPLYFNVGVVDAAPLSIGPDTTICPVGAAVFSMPSGFTQPLWNDFASSSNYTTSVAGPVWLAALDGNGCTVSDTALVSVFQFTQPLAVTGSTICLGQSTTLLATGSGTFTWFADAALTQVVNTGGQWFFDQPQDSALFYVVQSEGACSSQAALIALNVTPTPNDAQVNATSPVCLGAPFELWLTGTGDPTGAWATPTGSLFTGPVLSIASATAADEGEYLVVPSISGCAGGTLSITIDVLSPQQPALTDTVLCEGGSLTLALPGGYSNAEWSNGASGNSITITTGGTYSVTAADPNGCTVSAASVVTVVGCDPHLPNVITPNGDGWNDGFKLPPGGYVSAMLRVWNRWGQRVWEGDAVKGALCGDHENGEPLSEGTYYYELLLTRADGGVKPYTGYFSLLR